MGWKHIVVEGYCFFNSYENREDDVPKFCKDGPDSIGLHCIAGSEDDNTRCPHFAFGKARSTVIVTNDEGQDFACAGFYVEDEQNLNHEEYLEKEKEWINSWSEKILESTFDDNTNLEGYHYDLWIENENLPDGNYDVTNDNTDVIVKFEDGTRFWATFLTYDNINWLRQKNIKSGECMGGRYFWCSDLIIVDEISRVRIEEVIEHLITTGEFTEVFRCNPIK